MAGITWPTGPSTLGCVHCGRKKVTFHGRNLLTCCLNKEQKAKSIRFADFHRQSLTKRFRVFTSYIYIHDRPKADTRTRQNLVNTFSGGGGSCHCREKRSSWRERETRVTSRCVCECVCVQESRNVLPSSLAFSLFPKQFLQIWKAREKLSRCLSKASSPF